METCLDRHAKPYFADGTRYKCEDGLALGEGFCASVPHIAIQLTRGMEFQSSPASRCAQLAERLAPETTRVLLQFSFLRHVLGVAAMSTVEPSCQKAVASGLSRIRAVNNKPAVKPLSKMSATEINALPEKDFLAKLKPGTRAMLKDLWAIAPYLKK